MDKLILGLLMLQRLTAYEIRNIIKQNYSSMCSDSLGSIQVALKKLFSAGFITCREFVEKGVNKKQYSITDLGRQHFMEWLKTPIDMSKTKNIDLGKLLLMGFVPAKERAALVTEIILNLKNELDGLYEIQTIMQKADEKKDLLDYLEKNPEYSLGIQKATQNSDMVENVNGLSYFSAITLQYGIDSTKFEIQWFEKLRDSILK